MPLMPELVRFITRLMNSIEKDRKKLYQYRYGFGWIPKYFGWMGKGIKEQQFFKSPHAEKAEEFEKTLGGLKISLLAAEPEGVQAIVDELKAAVRKYATDEGMDFRYLRSLKQFLMSELPLVQGGLMRGGERIEFSLKSSVDELVGTVVARAMEKDSQPQESPEELYGTRNGHSLAEELRRGGEDQELVRAAERATAAAREAVKAAEAREAGLGKVSSQSSTSVSAPSSPKASESNPSTPAAGSKDKKAGAASQSQEERSPSPKLPEAPHS